MLRIYLYIGMYILYSHKESWLGMEFKAVAFSIVLSQKTSLFFLCFIQNLQRKKLRKWLTHRGYNCAHANVFPERSFRMRLAGEGREGGAFLTCQPHITPPTPTPTLRSHAAGNHPNTYMSDLRLNFSSFLLSSFFFLPTSSSK